MAQLCSKCGKELPEGSRADKLTCDDCRKETADMFYAYSELRFEVWEFLKHHGPEKTRDTIFNTMVDEEGMDWVEQALGVELVKAIMEGTDAPQVNSEAGEVPGYVSEGSS